MDGSGVVSGLRSVGRVQAKIGRVVTIVVGVAALAVAIWAFVEKKLKIGAFALVIVAMCALGQWLAIEALKKTPTGNLLAEGQGLSFVTSQLPTF